MGALEPGSSLEEGPAPAEGLPVPSESVVKYSNAILQVLGTVI